MENRSPQVTAHIDKIEIQHRETIGWLRSIFLDADSEIAEHIKWNSPAFYYNGQMKAFDPKEYKRDLAVINLHRGKILLVFPTGNKINTPDMGGKNYPDGRKIIEIQNLEDAQNKAQILRDGILNWIEQIEK